MRQRFILGFTVNGEIAFTEVERRDNGMFSAMFFTVLPFITNDVDMEELTEMYLDGLDKATLYDYCEQYDCSPNQLAEEMSEHLEIEDLMDCSLYNKTIHVNTEDWMFESGSCGQHDLRNEMQSYINEDVFNNLMSLWDEYHLKTIDANVFDKLINDLTNMIETSMSEEEWVKYYIDNFYC